MIALVSETYQGAPISLRPSDGWVNATQMAQAFGKRTNDFLRQASAFEFVAALKEDLSKTGFPVLEVCTVHHGGIAPGTWMHPDLALEFARWLSPEFAIWTNRVIRKVLSGQPLDDAQPGATSQQVSRILDCLAALADSHVRLERRVGEIEEYMTRPRLPAIAEIRRMGGRPDTHPVTLALELLAIGDCTVREIAARLGWSHRTLERKIRQLSKAGKVTRVCGRLRLVAAKEGAK